MLTAERPRPVAPSDLGRRPTASDRDPAIDAARAACLVVVFVLHAMMVGVSVGADGPVLENALEGWAGFAPATWVVQVMPLFFVIGGYAGWTQWRRERARGADAAAFARSRLLRLVRPAIALVAVITSVLLVLAAVGLPADMVATAGYRIGQPLWFLTVYLACSSLVPAMAWLHARHPWLTLGALSVAALSVDAARFASGVDAVGYVNLLVVWLLVQQLGFLLADGTVDRMSRPARLGTAAVALAVLAGMIAAGPHSVDLFANLNPPTICLAVLGVAQLAVFSLIRPALRRWAQRPRPQRIIARFGEWGMTLYLWHLPAFVLLAGVLLVLHHAAGLPLPAPLTAEWWWTRPVWLAAAALVTALVVRGAAHWERRPAAPRRMVAGDRAVRGFAVPVAVAVPAAIAGVGAVLVLGFGAWPGLLSLVLLAVALRGSSTRAGSLRLASAA
ncbi:acyltransferase [Agromyces aurantiacus]|uniref:Acyltransferase n=1 Tax=Agromyces aurantiacus TaxID=165814 RepID=A0ABV9R4K7_9MICO|nr:acyltransferase [Agromyces aurantiacus]MBM7503736.1 peptidoglycan/LPS O-acetylase OafA/YrhL [Agromyces aurantiacus]